jgi:hypothetical protein
MAKAYRDLRNNVRSNPERAARVETRRQAMEDALALAEIRESASAPKPTSLKYSRCLM